MSREGKEEMQENKLDEYVYKDKREDNYTSNYDCCYDFDLNLSLEIDEGDAIYQQIVSKDPRSDKIRRGDTNLSLNRQWITYSGGHSGIDLNVAVDPLEEDFNFAPLNDEFGEMNLPRIPIELETMIIARFPILEIRRVCALNKRISTLISSGDIVKERKQIGFREASVFMLASAENNWWAFNQDFTVCKILPELPSDITFKLSDKESLCAGSHLLVFGKEVQAPAIWTYEVLKNEWFKNTSMAEPRCLFASASSGDFAYVAGGFCPMNNTILNSAEKYDPVTRSWTSLPKMKEKRRMSSGVYMDNKFYVIGGHNQAREPFTCAEVYDEKENTWVKIPGMFDGLTTSESPPLIAVANNELYIFETSTNSLMVYLKDSNSWKDLGPVPVKADRQKGWGIAFKSLGHELLAIGGSDIYPLGRGMTVFSCCPNPNANRVAWRLLDNGRNRRSPFVMNCTVMVA